MMGEYNQIEALMHLRGKKILLVEDNEINAQITMLQLKEAGFEVFWCEDGKAGLDKYLESEPGTYSIIVTDIMMPVMDGNEMVEKIRARGREDANVPVLAITANAFPQDLLRFENSGINKCITKPYKKSVMLDYICKYIMEFEHINVFDN